MESWVAPQKLKLKALEAKVQKLDALLAEQRRDLGV